MKILFTVYLIVFAQLFDGLSFKKKREKRPIIKSSDRSYVTFGENSLRGKSSPKEGQKRNVKKKTSILRPVRNPKQRPDQTIALYTWHTHTYHTPTRANARNRGISMRARRILLLLLLLRTGAGRKGLRCRAAADAFVRHTPCRRRRYNIIVAKEV